MDIGFTQQRMPSPPVAGKLPDEAVTSEAALEWFGSTASDGKSGTKNATAEEPPASHVASNQEAPRRRSGQSRPSETRQQNQNPLHIMRNSVTSRGSSSSGSAQRCCLFGRRKKPRAFHQTVVLLRHSERRDYVDSSYKVSDEGKAWPHDAPLTEKGVALAQDVAEELNILHQEAHFVAVASSPYYRCLHTAAEVARKLDLPVLIDQEIGEVWDSTIPKDTVPHRDSRQLGELVTSLDMKVMNPSSSEGIKVFGKPPDRWPESLEDAHLRFIVRIEDYIRQSAEMRRNIIVVTHADAVAAVWNMFQRGGADVKSMDFCAQVTAQRVVDPKAEDQRYRSVYKDKWQVRFTRAGANIMDDPGSMGKYYERIHMEHCDETETKAVGRRNRRTDTAAMDAILDALERQPMFDKCGRAFIGRLIDLAERREVAAGEAINLSTLDALIVVERGAIVTCLGDGPSRTMGVGEVLNSVGMLSGEEEFRRQTGSNPDNRLGRLAPPSRPNSGRRESKLPTGYEIEGFEGQLPDLYSARRGYVDRKALAQKRSDGNELDNHALIFFGLCPYAAAANQVPPSTPTSARLHRRRHAMKRLCVQDELGFRVSGAPPEPAPAVADGSLEPAEDVVGEVMESQGGARLLLIRMANVNEVYKKARPESQDREAAMQVEQNWKGRWRIWKGIEKHMRAYLFKHAPQEVTWELAECAISFTADAGQDIVQENGAGENGDSVVLIEQGVATVEKRIRGDDHELCIGKLKQGAIIGDLSLVGSNIPRPASVRAKTRVECLRLPASGLLRLMQRFPGLVARNTETRLQLVASMMRERLPTCAEVAASLHMFREFDLVVLNEIAQTAEHCAYFVGEVVVAEGSTDCALYVVEHGRCIVEMRGQGKVADVPTGNCFGERTLLGIAQHANATVRVSSVFAMILQITRPPVNEVLSRNPEAHAKFEEMKGNPQHGRVKGMGSGLIELFRNCDAAFLDLLTSGMKHQGFLPGQSIVIEGAQELDPCMYVLTGGQVVAERNDKYLAEMTVGATFGELAVMGVNATRAVTIRALTYCTARAIPRSVFSNALKSFPEEEEYFQRCLNSPEGGSNRVPWPIFTALSKRFTYLLDLYQRQVRCSEGEQLEDVVKAQDRFAAVFLVSGEMDVEGSDGEEEGVIKERECFNEEALLGIEPRQQKLVARTHCELYVLSKSAWDRVLAELPEFQEEAEKEVRKFIVQKVKAQRQTEPGCGTLHQSPLFRATTPEFCEYLEPCLHPRIFAPGEEIAGLRLDGDSLFFWLQGVAKHPKDDFPISGIVKEGGAFGEAALLGITHSYEHQLTAQTMCVVEELRKSDFESALTHFPHEDELFQQLCEESMSAASKVSLRDPGIVNSASLDMLMSKSTAFRKVQREFIMFLCRQIFLKFYAPGEVIMEQDEICEVGKSPFFLLCSGLVQAEGGAGVVFGTIRVGEAIGEVGAFGIAKKRTASIRARGDKLACCAWFPGGVVKRAMEKYPHAIDPIVDVFSKREISNSEAEKQRSLWLRQVALPVLQRCSLFACCPEDFLSDVAVQLAESQYSYGSVITTVGETTTSMIIILKGLAEIVSRDGEVIGHLTVGGCFGEVAALGLLHTRMASLYAVTDCKVIEVPEAALRNALHGPSGEQLAQGFERLITSRREQVLTGLPITCLPVNASVENVAVRSLALLAERIVLKPKEVLHPLPVTEPGGPVICVLAAGRATLEMSKDGQVVMFLSKGQVVAESLADQFGAIVRADSYCEAYRLKEHDFLLCQPIKQEGVRSSESDEWFTRYRMFEIEARANMKRRLLLTRGLTKGLRHTSKDVELIAWNARRQQTLARSRRLRKDPVGERLREKVHLPRMQSETAIVADEPEHQFTLTFNNGAQSYPTQLLPSLCNKGSRPSSSSKSSMKGPSRPGSSSKSSLRPGSSHSATNGWCSQPMGRSRSSPHFESTVGFCIPGEVEQVR